MSSPILPLTLSDVVVRKRGRVILGPVSLTLPAEGFTIVLGPNGAGKSTLLRTMHGLDRIASGQLAWQVDRAEAQTRHAFVFQTPTMMRRSVRDSIAYPLRLHGTPRRAALDKAAEMAARFGLGEMLDRPAGVLSGGERQKLALARALIRKPEVLFLDEPCANLDGRAMREIEAALTEENARGTRILMATHHLGQARRLATDVLFLYRGALHEAGPAPDFFDAPRTRETRTFLEGGILE